MCLYFLARGFCNINWLASAMHSNFTSYVCGLSFPAFPQVVIEFWHDCFTCKPRKLFLQFAGKKAPTQFTCVTCGLPVKIGNHICFYAASTSRRRHATALNKACKLQVTSPAWCRLAYLQFADEFTRGVIADCLQLQIILCGIAGFFLAIVRLFFPAFAVFFACVWRVFLPAILSLLPVSCMYFCLQKQAILHASRGQFCMSSACKTTCKMPVVFR